jgi:hypothetical protein
MTQTPDQSPQPTEPYPDPEGGAQDDGGELTPDPGGNDGRSDQ